MGEVEQRIVANNRTFRDANERIKATSDEYGEPLERIPFLCECPMEDCMEILRLTAAEYSGIRANPARFFTLPDHAKADAAVGRVVSHEAGYVIVEKDGESYER